MRSIIEALLFLARADAESLHPEVVPMDLASWLDEHLRARHDARRGSDVTLEIGSQGAFFVRAHPSLLGDLLENLLDNAGKYSQPGTPILVLLDRDDSTTTTTITVRDRGIGIDDADLPHLFEPFYRSPVARARVATGLGLGLSIAMRLARSLGATIEAKSEAGAGSSFTIRFQSADHATGDEDMSIAGSCR